MMKLICIITVFYTFFVTSCNTTSKMHQRTGYKQLYNQLYEANKNAFYATSSHIKIALVWSYSNEGIVIYKLSDGAVVDRKMVLIRENKEWLIDFSKDDFYELDSCIELDGDLLGMKVMKDNKTEEKDLPVNLDCATKKKYNSQFLNKIISDMNIYKIKW